MSKNPLLNNLLEATVWPEPPRADYAWLGDAIAIKDPTAVVFRPQSGSNVLVVGQNDEAALSMMIMSVTQHRCAASASRSPGVRAFTCWMAVRSIQPWPDNWAGSKILFRTRLPVSRGANWPRRMAELAAEIKRRQESTSDDQTPIYIFIFDIQRFRDLRKSDDDFGYSRYDEDKPAPPAKLFTDVLRDGPPVGIHTIVWCDSVNNMNRTFDRQGIKEFENRILFQMSANDSSTLIDTPAGSKLGENRALYYSEEENKIEKFRPYGLPELAWLEGVKKRFAARPRPEVHVPPDGEANGAAALEVNGQRSDERGNRCPPVVRVARTGGAADRRRFEPPVEAL